MSLMSQARAVTPWFRSAERAPSWSRSRGRPSWTDELTLLGNRRAFFEGLDSAIATSAPQETHAVVLFDLDRFKEVNDSLGHLVGDRLLAEIAPRLSAQTRAGDLVARLGGDEFVLVLYNADAAGACGTAAYLRSVLQEPITVDGVTLHVDASIGVAIYPDHGRDAETLLRHADIAMYQAKERRDGPRLYRPGVEDGRARLIALDELRRAVAEGQLVLHYQPKLDLATGQVRAVEALVRWQHPDRGLLKPDAFLGLAESSGLITQLTDEVLRQALEQCAAWWNEGVRVSVAVNLSASTMLDPALPGMLRERLSAAGLPAEALQVEITEDVLLRDSERARAVVEAVHAMGVEVALDDFGSGYSSLAYLRELPVDVLKLDRAFVSPMATDRRAAALVHSAVQLAHSLGMRMVAEGVEDSMTLQRLAVYGCDAAQGFHVCRPVPANHLVRWLRARPLSQLAG